MTNQISRSLLVLMIFMSKVGISAPEKVPVITEYFAYQLIKEKPLENAHYIATPWAYLINHNLLAKIPEITGIQNGVTVCQHINYEQIIPYLKKMGIKTLFTPHVPNGKQYNGIT